MKAKIWIRASFLLAMMIVVLIISDNLYALDQSVFQDGTTAAANNDRSFFAQFIVAGGGIVWFVLLPMSVLICYLSIDIGLLLRRKNILPPNVRFEILNIIQKNSLSGIKDALSAKNDILSVAISRAISHFAINRNYSHLQNITAESLEEKTLELMRRVEWINIVGNIAPMVGLFGTVYGMIKTFNNIVLAGGQPRADQLASGISVALVTTFWGLLIAIPALSVYGFYRNKVEVLASEAAVEAENLLQYLNAKKDSSDAS